MDVLDFIYREQFLWLEQVSRGSSNFCDVNPPKANLHELIYVIIGRFIDIWDTFVRCGVKLFYLCFLRRGDSEKKAKL